MDKIKICFLIRQLNDGGAQRQLIALASNLDQKRFQTTIITFYDGGRFADDIKQSPHVSHVSLKKKDRWDIAGFVIRLIKLVKKVDPDILHGYLPTSNILSVILSILFSNVKIVWGIRVSNIDLDQYDTLTRLNYRLESILSRFTDLIIVNSESGFKFHLANGFPKGKMIVIPNGIDSKRFKPLPYARQSLRAEWEIRENEVLIGFVGRLDPMKDHTTFINAASVLITKHSNIRFAVVGNGPVEYKTKLLNLSDSLGLTKHLLWIDARSDMPEVYNAFDIATIASYGEGFPNVVAEAMACGIPCVVTDAGDTKKIVGDIGIVVPPGNPQALADGWETMISKLSSELGLSARQWIEEQYGIDNLVHKTESVLLNILKRKSK